MQLSNLELGLVNRLDADGELVTLANDGATNRALNQIMFYSPFIRGGAFFPPSIGCAGVQTPWNGHKCPA